MRLVAAPERPRPRSGTPIWIGLGVAVVVTVAAIIGTVLRTSAAAVTTSASAVATTPPTQASAVPPTTAPSAAPTDPPAAPAATWDKVAQCESSGNWATNTGNGFYGGLQFTASTWRSFGGAGMPYHATRAEQIAVGERVLAAQGWKAWPVCSRKLGLR